MSYVLLYFVEFVPSLFSLETCLTVLHYLTGIQGQSLQRQWQSKPWRRWSHLLHLCSSCLLLMTTTSCVGSLRFMDWSLPDCRLLWHHHHLLDFKFLYQLMVVVPLSTTIGSRRLIAGIRAVQFVTEGVLSIICRLDSASLPLCIVLGVRICSIGPEG